MKASKSGNTAQVPYLTTGAKKYVGDRVADGFFDSISNLKSQDKEVLHSSESYKNFSEDYQNILKICKEKKVLPSISIAESNKLIFKLKPHVNDFFSITATHYINAGNEGLLHFNFLLNCVIEDVNLSTVDELNVVYALLLHKGHGKVKTSDRSY